MGKEINIGIIATGSYLPSKIITNEDIVKKGVKTSDKWIQEKIGIKERRSADGEKAHEMASKAVMNLLSKTELNPKDIDLIICLSATPDFLCPATACWIQNEIGAKNAVCFDMNSICSSPIVGIETAHKYLKDGTYKNAVIVCVESPIKNMALGSLAKTKKWSDYLTKKGWRDLAKKATGWDNRGISVFFGDGAGCVLLGEVEKEKGLLGTYFKTDGTRGHALTYEIYGGADMDGKAIWNFAIEAFPEAVREVTKKCNYSVEDLDFVISHQANLNIIKVGMKTLGLSRTKTHNVIEKYGNTIGASTFIALDDAIKEGKIKRGDLVCLAAFGGGLSWGSILFRL